MTFSIVSTVIGGGSSQGIFSSVNQFQLLLIFPLFKFYLPLTIISFYQSLDWTLLSFDFIKFQEIEPFDKIYGEFESVQEDEYLNIIGIQQSSSLLNIFSVV